MNETVLSLSLLNERLAAIAVHRGAAAGTWQRPAPVTDVSDFTAVMREAVRQTGYAGTIATLVIAHQRLAQQLVETPPIKGQNLRSFLDRRVQQLKPFPTDAAWSYQPTQPTRNGPSLLLHLLPKPFLDQIVQSGQVADVKFVRVVPATAVLQRQLAALPLGPDEAALLAAETGGTTTVVIGRREGQIYLGRTLSNDWTTHGDRVGVDINRTILYVKQQFGVTVGSVWLFGSGAESQLRLLQTTLRLPVQVSPVPPAPLYWAQEAAKIPVDDTSNLISTEQLQAPRRRVLLRVTTALVALLALLALVTAGGVQFVLVDRTRQLRALESRASQLHERRAALQQREREFLQQKEFVKVVSEERPQPVPGWFLGYLGNALPRDLYLSRFRLYRDEDLWRVELEGALQPTTNTAPAQAAAAAVAGLKDNLAQGPFHVRFTEEGQGRAPAVDAASTNRIAAMPLEPTRFFVQGVMNGR